MNIQKQYDSIYSFFKTTTEYFDEIQWDGIECLIIFKNKVIEKYSFKDLDNLIVGFVSIA
ncbi:MAG: hypothetical protein Ta2B_30170 [Termitinemataceae bacterium]|nr:MAG: hypothetical protein Ta2B_30170 [Termitinemataceae bacterium]